MKAKKVLLVAIIALLATGCTKHTIVADRTLKVGNIYCSDGSVMDPDTYKSEGRDNAAGVIFWVNDTLDTEDKAYIVSLSNARKNIWCDSLVSTGVSTSIDQYDGAANTAMLQTFEVRTSAKAPAMEIAVNFSEGIANWHLPSVKELMEIYRNKAVIKYALQACDGEGFDKVWYWSSTEDNSGEQSKHFNAYIVSLKEGRIQASHKFDSYHIRPVKAIK